MPTPQHGRHLSNHVEPEVVEALRNAVVAPIRSFPPLLPSEGQVDGLDKLQVWDRNAPLPTETPAPSTGPKRGRP